MTEEEYEKKRWRLSARLIEARERKKLTQRQVEDTGIMKQSELSKLENSSRRLDFLVLLELAELYEQPLDFFRPDADDAVPSYEIKADIPSQKVADSKKPAYKRKKKGE